MPNEETSAMNKAYNGGGSEPRRSHKCRNICVAATVTVVVIVLILVILCLTVFKAKNPKLTVNSVVLRDLHTEFDMPKLRVEVNITLDVEASVKNPNKVGVKFSSSNAYLYYRGELVGQAPIGAGEISADETEAIDVTLTVMADQFLDKSAELFSDVVAGTIPFNSVTKISGKVTILGIFKVHVVSTSSCDFNVYVSNGTTGDQVCTYKTKL